VDTTSALYVWEWSHYPQYYIPVDDMAQTFTLFLRIVSEVAAYKGPDTDPVRIREQIPGPR
jgi:uncharacterized protein (DUF427 family)